MWTFPVLPLTVFYISLRFAGVSRHGPVINARDEKIMLILSIWAIGIIQFEKRFYNFIADTMNWFQNSRSD